MTRQSVLIASEKRIRLIIDQIIPLDDSAMNAANERWLSLCKPLYALGQLESLVIRLAGIQRRTRPVIGRKAIAIFAADNGVVAQGVTQVGQDVTATVTYNFVRGITTVNAMARVARADLFPIDIGINQPDKLPGVIDRRIRPGTADLSQGPAMSRAEAVEAILAGADMAVMLKNQGYEMLGTGEMGIGNTTTSSAVLAVLSGQPAASLTGRGAGLCDEKLRHKQAIIEKGIACNQPDPHDAIDILHKVGGLDLAGLAGLYIGAAACQLPIVIDGFIASVAALLAAGIAPGVKPYLLASHESAEPGGALALQMLGLPAWIKCGMRVGEGTGCCVAFSLFDHALAAYDNLATFEEAGVGAYLPLSTGV